MWPGAYEFLLAIGALALGIAIFTAVYYAIQRKSPFVEMQEDNTTTEVPPSKTAKLLFFYVNWCPHCRSAKPVWAQLEKSLDGMDVGGYTVHLEKINAEADRRRASLFKVNQYPTVKLVTDKTIWTFSGPFRQDTLTAFVTTCLSSSS